MSRRTKQSGSRTKVKDDTDPIEKIELELKRIGRELKMLSADDSLYDKKVSKLKKDVNRLHCAVEYYKRLNDYLELADLKQR